MNLTDVGHTGLVAAKLIGPDIAALNVPAQTCRSGNKEQKFEPWLRSIAS
jgi:hypothetical protein